MVDPQQAAISTPLPSTQPTLSPAIQGVYMGRQHGDQADTLREFMMSFGMFNAQLQATVVELANIAKSVQQQAASSPGGSVVPRPGGHVAAPAPIAPTSSPGMHIAEAAAPGNGSQQSEGAAFHFDRHMSMSDATRGLAGEVAKVLSQRASYQFRTSGDATGPGGGALLPEDIGGGQQGYAVRDGDGNVVRSIPLGDDPAKAFSTASRMQTRSGHFGTLAGYAGRLSEGEGAIGALGGGAAEVAGVAGGALLVGEKGMQFYTNQYQQGAQYRQIYGADAGRFAISQRLGAQAAGIGSYLSGEGRERGMQAYQAASEMGLSGDQRQGAIDFDSSMYSKYGMSVQQSMQFVGMHAENSTISLKDLADQIDKVGKSAVGAGRNAQEAIDTFGQVAAGLQSNVTQGAGSIAIAGGVTTALQRALPKDLSNTADIQAFTGLLSQQSVMQYAALTGQSPGTVLNQVALQSSGATALAVIAGREQEIVNAVCAAGGTTPEALRADIARRYPGLKQISADQLLAVLADYPSLNSATIGTVFSALGFNLKPAQYLPMFAQMIMGNTAGIGTAAQAAAKAAGGPSVSGGASGTKSLAAPGGGSGPVVSGAFKPVSASDANYISGADLYSDYLTKSGPLKGTQYTDLTKYGFGSSAMDYGRYEATSGNRDTAVENLLAHAQQFQSDTGTSLDETKFNTAKGPKTLGEILKDPSLLAALNKGQINAMGAGNTPLDLTKYTGISADSVSGTATGGSVASGGVTIDLTPLAKKILKLSGPSDDQRAGKPSVGTISPQNWF